LRRDDRPAAAAKLLMLGRQFGMDAPIDRTQLSAVLLEAGEVLAAVDLARSARSDAVLIGDPPLIALTRDSLVGTLLAAGFIKEARHELGLLAELKMSGAEISRRFREAQIARLDGLFAKALSGYEALAALLAPHSEASGPLAACYQEAGEILVLRAALGEIKSLEKAEIWFKQAAEAWRRGHRRAGLYRSEAWGLRVRALKKLPVLPTTVDRALQYARERGLVLLEADLLVTLAILKKSPKEALDAVGLCAESPLAKGRAQVIAWELGGPEPDYLLLREDAVWMTRCLKGTQEGEERARVLLDASS
jgi:tetratricopeptide (TPR) repeat protein